MAFNPAIDLTLEDDQGQPYYDRDALVAELALLTEEIEVRQNRVYEIQDILTGIERAEESRRQNAVAEQFLGQKSSLTTYSWSELLEHLRTSIFHIPCWRPMQKEICDCVLSGNDCMVFLPAGSGKSLCFQLPALVSQGQLTLVISPLVALMHDQVTQLQQLRINAAKMTKDTHSNAVEGIYSDITAGTLSLLYVSPELLLKSKRLQSKLSKISSGGKLARIAIDEAHCCSNWGHDFRPDYRALRIIRKLCPGTGITALTATADENTANDVKKILNLSPSTVVFRQSCDRPNLYYEVRIKPSSTAALIKEMAALITERFANQSGIIYALSKKDCETICEQLQELGVACASYHAGFDSDVKEGIYDMWQSNHVQVVVATIAFGMGVSKSDVRFVIHQSLSKSLSGYYQESGRAGRDRKDAACILYYSPQDALRVVAMGVESHNSEIHLIDMVRYCQDLRTCRHLQIERHFSEKALSSSCQRYCDNCVRNPESLEKRDVSGPVKAMLAEFEKLDLAMTIQQLSDGWRGIGSAEYKLPSYAQLDKKQFSKSDAQRIIVHLIINGYLSFSYVANAYNVQAYVKFGVNNTSVPSPYMVTLVNDSKSKKVKENVQGRSKYTSLPVESGTGFLKHSTCEKSADHQHSMSAIDGIAEKKDDRQCIGPNHDGGRQFLSDFPELEDASLQFEEEGCLPNVYSVSVHDAPQVPESVTRSERNRPTRILDLTGDDDECGSSFRNQNAPRPTSSLKACLKSAAREDSKPSVDFLRDTKSGGLMHEKALNIPSITPAERRAVFSSGSKKLSKKRPRFDSREQQRSTTVLQKLNSPSSSALGSRSSSDFESD